MCRYTLARFVPSWSHGGPEQNNLAPWYRIISHLGTWDYFGRSRSHRLRIANWELVHLGARGALVRRNLDTSKNSLRVLLLRRKHPSDDAALLRRAPELAVRVDEPRDDEREDRDDVDDLVRAPRVAPGPADGGEDRDDGRRDEYDHDAVAAPGRHALDAAAQRALDDDASETLTTRPYNAADATQKHTSE